MRLIMTQDMLRARASLLRATRAFFHNEGYIEVDPPLLSERVIPEQHIDLFETRYDAPYSADSHTLYLLPSPERFMKPLLQLHEGRIFSLAHSFRNRESLGSQHSPEFTMLEYYEVDVDERDMMRRTTAFLRYLLRDPILGPLARRAGRFEMFSRDPQTITLSEAFARFAGVTLFGEEFKEHKNEQVDVSSPDPAPFAHRCHAVGIEPPDVSTWRSIFDFVLADRIEEALPGDRPVFLVDWPAASTVLAQQKGPIRHRFELYLGGMEIANCFLEEWRPELIRDFFERENALRLERGAPEVPPAYEVADALTDLPRISGTALGFDRLLMQLSGTSSIEGVILSPLHGSV